MEILDSLRSLTRENAALELLNNMEPSSIDEATHVSLENVLVPLDSKLPLYKAKQLDLRFVVFVWQTQHLNAAMYLTAASEKNLPQITFLERNDLLDYLKGSKPTCDTLMKAESNNDEELKQIKQNEYTLRSRKTYLTPPGNKNFSHLSKMCFEFFLNNKKPQEQKSLKKKGSPIILVPPGYQPMINMFNVKQFLESGIFEKVESIQKKQNVEIQRRNQNSKKPWKFLVYDSIDKFQSQDWDNIAAVFTSGMEWQFNGFKYMPAELFSRTKGYHIKYLDEETPQNIKNWNVKVLNIHRHKRHLDQPLVQQFWMELEKFVLSVMPHLLN